jgi:cell division protein FtsW
MGGTSMLFTSIAFGIILSVSRDIDEPKGAEMEMSSGNKIIVGEIA